MGKSLKERASAEKRLSLLFVAVAGSARCVLVVRGHGYTGLTVNHPRDLSFLSLASLLSACECCVHVC